MPGTPAREYIRFNGQVVAIENRIPSSSTVDIDFPVGLTTYAGVQTFSGWALDNTSTVSRVSIMIDGISYGYAQYGGPRPDVCQVEGSHPGCPYVGWSISVNTASLANGSHTLSATAFTTDATPRQSTSRVIFYTSNSTVAPQSQSLVEVDVPSWQAVYSGQQQFSGWAIDNTSAIANVDVAIDGISYGSANYGGNRPDVCAVYPGRVGCPNVGWAFYFDTSQLADGPHTLAITVFTADATPRETVATIEFTTSNSNAPAVDVDVPAGLATYTGTQNFSGWAIDSTSTMGAVTIAIDGNSYGNAVYGTNRKDACDVLGDDPGCPNVGWYFSFNTAELTNGPHTLTVTGFTAEGVPRKSTQNIVFIASNANSAAQNKSRMYTDVPAPQKIYSGLTTFFGWAIDDTSAIQSVSVAIDGISYGSAGYGTNRPDVCAAYPGRAGCPNVGWSFSIDTAQLTDGSHTLTVTAFTADAVSRQTTSTTIFSTVNSQTSEARFPKSSMIAAQINKAPGFWPDEK